MADWCIEHPWMTFFIAMTLASSIGTMFRIVIARKEKS